MISVMICGVMVPVMVTGVDSGKAVDEAGVTSVGVVEPDDVGLSKIGMIVRIKLSKLSCVASVASVLVILFVVKKSMSVGCCPSVSRSLSVIGPGLVQLLSCDI